jgi:hypothetical protein
MGMQSRSADELVRRVLTSQDLLERVQGNPKKALPELAATVISEMPIYRSDRIFYRVAVLALGLVTICATIGAIVLAARGVDAPELLTALGSGAIGALAGLLMPGGADRG